MKTINIPMPGKEGLFYHIYKEDDFEFVNPIQKISELIIDLSIEYDRNFLTLKGFVHPNTIIESFLRKKAIKEWEDEYNEIMSSKPHINFYSILESTSKNKQIKALKGLSITDIELTSFIFRAWKDYGFKYSIYSSTHYQEGFDKSQLPILTRKNEQNKIISIGNTSLTEGQLRQTIEQRKVTIAKFLDKGEIWHCFFFTYNSLKGKENYKNGQPHLHYISSNWGLSREEVKVRVLSKNSVSSSVHIDYFTHRNPKK